MVADRVTCVLCGLPTDYPVTDDQGQPFCCPACCEVSSLLAAPVPMDTAVEIPTQTETMTVSLGGLWCPSCTWLIGETIERTPGVVTAATNFIQREAQITFDPNRIQPKRILGKIRRLGYRAWLPGDTPYDDEEAHWTRLLISGVLVMHIMLISIILYARTWLGWASPDTEWLAEFFHLMLLVMSLPVVVILGVPILRAGGASLLRGRPNTHTLIAIGATAAFALSVRNFMAGQNVYFDTVAVLLFLVALGRWLEMQAQKAGGHAVARLWEQMPETAVHVTAQGDKTIPLDEVAVGMRLRLQPGDRIPADGVIASGRGDVDESLLTGEPEPVSRQVEDSVLAGTHNLDGSLEILVTAVGQETVAGQIGRLLHQALWQRAPIERLADKLAAWMVPTAVLLAVGTFAFWGWQTNAETALIHALSVLLIACPCALGIATPLTLWLGLERAAEAGVILRHTGALEQLAGVRHVFFDKTGTLSQRPIRLQEMVTADGIDPAIFRVWVTAIESHSEHPLAQAITNENDLRLTTDDLRLTIDDLRLMVDEFQALPGLGVTGCIGQTAVYVGNMRLMQREKFALPESLAQQANAWRETGFTIIYAGWNGRVTGLLALGETARPEAAQTVQQLQYMGLSVTVLTGDDAAAGQRWQERLGVPVLAEQRPEEKLAHLQAVGEGIVMVGDGINDGPALAAADVGIAVSQGTDVAQAAADAILLHDDLSTVPWLVTLAQQTMRKVRQNLAWAFVYNLFGLSLAISGHLQPAIAALLMVASSFVVTRNALRLRTIAVEPQKAAATTAKHPPAAEHFGRWQAVANGSKTNRETACASLQTPYEFLWHHNDEIYTQIDEFYAR